MKTEFIDAKPVWGKGLSTTMNKTLGFCMTVNYNSQENLTLRLASSGIYRVFVNGDFVHHGPARGPHGYFRVDEIPLQHILHMGINHIAVEVVGYNVNNFYIIDQPSFIQYEIIEGEKVYLSSCKESEETKTYELDYRESATQRYSFQRTFTEVYNLGQKDFSWRLNNTSTMRQIELEEVVYKEKPKYLDRHVSYPQFKVHIPEKLMSMGSFHRVPKKEYWLDRSMVKTPIFKTYSFEEMKTVLSHELEELQCIHNKDCSTDELTLPLRLNANDYAIYKYPYNNTGFIGINIQVDQDCTVYLSFDELYNMETRDVDFKRMDCVNGLKFTLRQGDYYLESMEPYTLQYLKIMSTGSCHIKEVHLREYINSDTQNISFQCSDPIIEDIFYAGLNTFNQNAVDIFMDCPSRERTGFLCDSLFTARVAYDLCGHTKIEDNFIENYMLPNDFNEIPNGIVPMCYPADHTDGVFIPNWALWLILQLEEYLLIRKPCVISENYKTRVRDILKYLKNFENEHGLLEDLDSWIFVEWSKSNDYVDGVNYPTNMLYSKALIVAGELLQEDGFIQRGEKLKKIIVSQSFNGEFFVDHSVRKDSELIQMPDITETCQYYAFYFDIATKESHLELFRTLISQLGPARKEGVLPNVHPSNAFIGYYLRLEILSRYGYSEQVMDEIKSYFTEMAHTTGTLWEFNNTQASCNHGFASHVIRYILKHGLGIESIDHMQKKVVFNEEHCLESYSFQCTPKGRQLHISKTENNGPRVNDESDYTDSTSC